MEEVIEYLTGHGDVWDFTDSQLEQVEMKLADWEHDIASLDAAILALLDTGIEEECLDNELDNVLEGSLFSRKLAYYEHNMQMLVRRFVKARAHCIWRQTSTSQRRGYHVAGVGLRAGRFLDANIANLVDLLLRAEAAVVAGDSAGATDSIVEFARLVFQTEPFRPSGTMPDYWENALREWIEGKSASKMAPRCFMWVN